MARAKYSFDYNGKDIEVDIYIGDTLTDNVCALLTFKTDLFYVTGVKIVTSHKGELFLAFPSRKGKDGNYHDIVFPASKNVRDRLTHMALVSYERVKNEVYGNPGAPKAPAQDNVGWSNIEHNSLPFN